MDSPRAKSVKQNRAESVQYVHSASKIPIWMYRKTADASVPMKLKRAANSINERLPVSKKAMVRMTNDR